MFDDPTTTRDYNDHAINNDAQHVERRSLQRRLHRDQAATPRRHFSRKSPRSGHAPSETTRHVIWWDETEGATMPAAHSEIVISPLAKATPTPASADEPFLRHLKRAELFILPFLTTPSALRNHNFGGYNNVATVND